MAYSSRYFPAYFQTVQKTTPGTGEYFGGKYFDGGYFGVPVDTDGKFYGGKFFGGDFFGTVSPDEEEKHEYEHHYTHGGSGFEGQHHYRIYRDPEKKRNQHRQNMQIINFVVHFTETYL